MGWDIIIFIIVISLRMERWPNKLLAGRFSMADLFLVQDLVASKAWI